MLRRQLVSFRGRIYCLGPFMEPRIDVHVFDPDALRWAPSRGVRGGRARVGDITLVLTRYELVPGVRVSGTYRARGSGVLRITGSGATGTLRVRPSGRMTGVLDGEVVRYQPLG